MKKKFEGLGLIGAILVILIGFSLLGNKPQKATKEQPSKCSEEQGWVQCRGKVLNSVSTGLTHKITMLTQSGETLTIFSRRPLSPTSEYQNWNLKKEGENIKEIELASTQPKESHTLCAVGDKDSDESLVRYISPFSRYPNTASLKKGVKPLEYNEKGMAVIGPDGLVIETRPRTQFEENDCSSFGI